MAGRNRAVRVATVALNGQKYDSDKKRFDFIVENMNFASFDGKLDIICTPEAFLSKAETVPGPATKRLSGWAREHNCYVIAGLLTLVDGRKYNSAVLIDRQGKISGQYNKIYLTEDGIKKGMCPGSVDPPVFQTDFSSIGIQICFDINWHRTWERLKEKGAEIVFWPSAYTASRHLSALAWINEFHIVSSTWHSSQIVDISGDVLSRSGRFTPWASAVVHLSKRLFEIDYHIPKTRQIKKKYGERVSIVFQDDEDWFTLASLDPELSVEDIIKEFKLIPFKDYHDRCEAANNRVRKKFVCQKK